MREGKIKNKTEVKNKIIVDFEYIIEYWNFSDMQIVGYTKDHTKEEKERIHIRYCRKLFDCKKWSNKKILKNTSITKTEKPKTFPKFSNEKPFKLKWGKGFIRNPKILAIKWTGFDWEYKLENIGHWFDYQKEKKLSLI